jgi:hypothetical protein
MEPANWTFGGGARETMMHPLVASLLLFVFLLIQKLPRNKVIVPFLFTYFSVPIGQVLVLGGIHFTALRILIIAGLIRRASTWASSREGKYPGGYNTLDKVIVIWTITSLICICVQWMNWQNTIARLGDFLDSLGGFMVARYFIPDRDAVRRTIKVLAAVCIVQSAFMMTEQIIHQNLYGYIGGWPIAVTYRNGHIRSQGVMGNLNAGVFGGALVPMFFWLFTQAKSRVLALLGIAGAITMVFTSDASSATLSLGASILGLSFWFLRKQMRVVRWALSLTLIGLHLAMKAPVWALIARIDLTGSSSGYHRFELVDNCVNHFSEWWLLGTRYYDKWGFCMFDLCNQFVVCAVQGGLVGLVLFITMYSRSFGAIGTARKLVSGYLKQEWFLWCLGCTLFAHVVSSFGINYMALMQMALFPLFSFVSVVAFEAKKMPVRAAQTLQIPQIAAQGHLPLSEAN